MIFLQNDKFCPHVGFLFFTDKEKINMFKNYCTSAGVYMNEYVDVVFDEVRTDERVYCVKSKYFNKESLLDLEELLSCFDEVEVVVDESIHGESFGEIVREIVATRGITLS